MISFEAFSDELMKISGAAGVALRYGKTLAKGVGKHVGKSVYRTARDLGTPVRSTKRALKHEFKDIREKGLKGINKGHVFNVAGAAATAPDVLKKEDPTGKGRSRLHRAAAWTGDQAGGFVGAKHGLPGAIAGGVIGRGAGSVAGGAVDKVLPKKKNAEVAE